MNEYKTVLVDLRSVIELHKNEGHLRELSPYTSIRDIIEIGSSMREIDDDGEAIWSWLDVIIPNGIELTYSHISSINSLVRHLREKIQMLTRDNPDLHKQLYFRNWINETQAIYRMY